MKAFIILALIFNYIDISYTKFLKYVTIPFYIDYIPSSTNISEEKLVIEYLDNLHTYSKIKIGDPQQELKMTITSKNYFFYLLNSKLDNGKIKGFNDKKSDTFAFLSYLSLRIDDITSLGEFKDHIDITQEKLDLNLFYLPMAYAIQENKIHKYKNGGYIGLSGNVNAFYNRYNIIELLKIRVGFINYDFFFNYTSKYSGNIVIGMLPFNLLSNVSSNDFYEVKEGIIYEDINWNYIINFIIIGNTTLEYSKNVLMYSINFEDFLFTAPNSFIIIFKNIFFQEYINNKKCFEDIYNDYIYLYCNKHDVDFNKINIEFETRLRYPLKTIYSFNDCELFYEYGDYKYFLIRFHSVENEFNKHWTFGQLFLRKYMFSFNQDKKSMYIKLSQRQIIPVSGSKSNIYIVVILICIVIILCIILGRILYNKYTNKKNLRYATELTEEVGYISY